MKKRGEKKESRDWKGGINFVDCGRPTEAKAGLAQALEFPIVPYCGALAVLLRCSSGALVVL